MFGAPLVGWLAESVFGYSIATSEQTVARSNVQNANALGSAMALCTLIPWGLCFCFYSMLHFTYPPEAARAKAEKAAIAKAEKEELIETPKGRKYQILELTPFDDEDLGSKGV